VPNNLQLDSTLPDGTSSVIAPPLVVRGVYAELNPDAFQHNLLTIKKRLKSTVKILLMLKANAYGHDLLMLAPYLTTADAIGLATFDAAIKMRQVVSRVPIVMMQGFSNLAEFELCVKYRLTPIIHHASQLDILENCAADFSFDCWLKVNTGMNRLGFSPSEFYEAYHRLSCCSIVNNETLVVLTHLASADVLDSSDAKKQIELFDELVRDLDCQKSVCNSAALFRYPKAHYDWVRPGWALYGDPVFLNQMGLDLPLLPVMTVKARVIALQYLNQGDLVGYGGTYRCEKPLSIAVINIGYGDGYPRDAAIGTPVLIRGQRCPLVGRVSMDMITVDVSHLIQVDINDEVILWGEGLPLKEVALKMGCFELEILARVTQRIPVRLANKN
jgi:alanine racemase